MKKVFRSALCACVAGFVLASCESENGGSSLVPTVSNPDVFILCEGVYQANNADISAYRSDSMRCTGEYYLAQNGRYLGDTGQDILYHGVPSRNKSPSARSAQEGKRSSSPRSLPRS